MIADDWSGWSLPLGPVPPGPGEGEREGEGESGGPAKRSEGVGERDLRGLRSGGGECWFASALGARRGDGERAR